LLAYVSALFADAGAGEVTILVEEPVNGVRVTVHGHFEFVLQRGTKKIGIVEAKKEDMDQGTAQNLLGLEALSDIENLRFVCGIVTNFVEWIFLKSFDDRIERDIVTLQVVEGMPSHESLSIVSMKIYALLTE
jgi:hypothetical protein